MAEESMREALSASFDKAEASGSSPSTPSPAPAPAVETNTPAPAAPGPTGDQGNASLAAPPVAEGQPAADPPLADPYPVPRGWKPDIREKWVGIPREVQEEVLRREKEINSGLQTASAAKKFKQEFDTLITPYQPYFDVDRMTPMQGFKEYLTTSALLRSGTPQQKASALAGVISQFGVDVQMLDQYLAAAIQGRGAAPEGQPNPQQYHDPRVDQILQRMQQQEKQFQERQTGTLKAEVATFEKDTKNEFFNDVRDDVADLLEMAANRGKAMTLKQAYDRACEMNPDVRKVVEARKIEAARASAVSLRPGGAPQASAKGAGDKVSMRESLDRAWSAHQT